MIPTLSVINRAQFCVFAPSNFGGTKAYVRTNIGEGTLLHILGAFFIKDFYLNYHTLKKSSSFYTSMAKSVYQ